MLGFPLGPSTPAVTRALVCAALSLHLVAHATAVPVLAAFAFHTTWVAALAVFVELVHDAIARISPRRPDAPCDEDLNEDEY